MLTVVDGWTRQCLAIEVDTSMGGQRVARVLEGLIQWHGRPAAIQSDNGPEFAGKALDGWADERKIEHRFIQPGKPMQNGHIESFNGRLRDECLNEHWLRNLPEARRMIEQWRQDYNGRRPHGALDYRTPIANPNPEALPSENSRLLS